MSKLFVSPISFHSPLKCKQALSFNGNESKTSTGVKTPNSQYVDVTSLYDKNEIIEIRNRAGAPNFNFPSRYVVQYNPQNESLIINNTNFTNDTTEIYKDGSARHLGSWHNNEIAEKNALNDIITDAKNRYGNIAIV